VHRRNALSPRNPSVGQSLSLRRSVAIRWWIGKRLQCLLHGEKKLRRMRNGYVIDFVVIELRVAMRQNVAESLDVAGVRNLFRDGRQPQHAWPRP
jgi:hypothetical protein